MAVLQSSHLQTHDYDVKSLSLTISFTNGAVYQYSGVPSDVAVGLSRAGSPGGFFWANIRGKYPTTKLASAARVGTRRR